MKKGFLLASILFGTQLAFGQFTQSNEPAVGASNSMYIVDTLNNTFASITNVTGDNVSWDYTTVGMTLGNTESISVNDASSSTVFTSSTKSITQGTFEQYLNSSSTERTSQGFIFTEPTFGVITITFENDEAKLMNYPFNFEDEVVDSYNGTMQFDFMGMPVQGTVTGTVITAFDGRGTLRLPDMDIPNVVRVTTIDTTIANGIPVINTAEVIRIQHEYYDLSDSELPIFLDAYLSISGIGAQRQVLSKNFSTVGVGSLTIDNLTLYPNPSAGEFQVSGDFNEAQMEVTDMTGRVVFSGKVVAGSNVKLNNVKAGIYAVTLRSEGRTSTQKITVK